MIANTYPSEHGADADALRSLIGEHKVLLVEMGHVYAATRAVEVRAKSENGDRAGDSMRAFERQDSDCPAPARKPGTQCGPYKNGRGWPSPRHAAKEQARESVQ